MNVDPISWKILCAVQYNGRISLKALADEAGLSLPATSERLKRLEESGLISGYRAVVNPKSVGYSITAVVGMTIFQPSKTKLLEKLEAMKEVTECLHVTGQDSYILRVVAKDLSHLEELMGRINAYGETRTSIILSEPIPQRAVACPD